MTLSTSTKVLIGFIAFLLLLAYAIHLIDKGYRDYNPLPVAKQAPQKPMTRAEALAAGFVDEETQPTPLRKLTREQIEAEGGGVEVSPDEAKRYAAEHGTNGWRDRAQRAK